MAPADRTGPERRVPERSGAGRGGPGGSPVRTPSGVGTYTAGPGGGPGAVSLFRPIHALPGEAVGISRWARAPDYGCVRYEVLAPRTGRLPRTPASDFRPGPGGQPLSPRASARAAAGSWEPGPEGDQ
ncbi:hypothetical protein GCM10010232_39630 [Streptomyces amakusaensis]